MINIKSPEIFGDELEKVFGERLKKDRQKFFETNWTNFGERLRKIFF